jgi:flagellar basal body-associated protein FliL
MSVCITDNENKTKNYGWLITLIILGDVIVVVAVIIIFVVFRHKKQQKKKGNLDEMSASMIKMSEDI